MFALWFSVVLQGHTGLDASDLNRNEVIVQLVTAWLRDMDPLSALSLAGNILKFAQYAFKLISSTERIHLSASGESSDEQHVEWMQARLLSFSALLKGTPTSKDEACAIYGTSKHSVALEKLGEKCQGYCEQLLSIIHKLQAEDGTKSRWWTSFQQALYEIWKMEDIEVFKGQIRECHAEIVMHLCIISR